MASNLRSEHARYTFRRLGKQGSFHALRAPTWNTPLRSSLDSQQFQGEVAGWLIENAQGAWHVGRAPDVHGYARMPHALRSRNALCVLIESDTDLAAFDQAFTVVARPGHLLAD